MTSKNSDTADQIAASLKKIMKTKSIDKIKIKEITDEAGLMRPTFYNHFQDKYEVVEYIFSTDVILPALPFLQKGLMKEAVLFMFTAIEKDYDFYSKEIKRTGQNSFQEILERASLKYLTPILKERIQKPVHKLVTPEHIAEYYAWIFEFILTRWFHEKEKIPVSQLMELYDLIISKPLEAILESDIKKDKMSD